MDVEVKGAVNAPGKYRVAASTTVEQLLSHAGGKGSNARLDGIQIVHDTLMDPTIAEPVMFLDYGAYLTSGNRLYNPILYPNDTIIVPAQSDDALPARPWK